MFVDRVIIELQAGKGGDGCSSMRREKYVPRGGPDGGNGGDGGSLILESRLGVNSLAAYANRRMYRAPKGAHGQGSMRHGKKGNDQTLLVPPGTTVIDAEHGFVIKDLKKHGEQFVIARGGRGGARGAAGVAAGRRAGSTAAAGRCGESVDVRVFQLKYGAALRCRPAAAGT